MAARRHDDRPAAGDGVELPLVAWVDDETGEQQVAPEAPAFAESFESASIPTAGSVPSIFGDAESDSAPDSVANDEYAGLQPDLRGLLGVEAESNAETATKNTSPHRISRPMVAAAAFGGLALLGLSAALALVGTAGSPSRAPISGSGIFSRPTLGVGLVGGPAPLRSLPAVVTPGHKPSPAHTIAPVHRAAAPGATHSAGNSNSGSAQSSSPSNAATGTTAKTVTTTGTAKATVTATPTQAAAGPIKVSGSIQCQSKNVEGVWIQAAGGGSGWAPWVSSAAHATYATYSYTLPHGGDYSVHIGCGGTTASWAVATYSSFYGGTVNDFYCYDESSSSEYSVCEKAA